MKKFIFGLFALALFNTSTPTINAQTETSMTTQSICTDADGNTIDCETGQPFEMGQPKKKRKKR